jgi:hypothetical protein
VFVLEVTLDYEATEEIRKKIWKVRESWGKEFHRSDLVYCELKPYCRLTGIEAKPTVKAVENWVIGEIGHIVIQRAFDAVEVEKKLDGVEVHHDVEYEGVPLEIKTTTLRILNPTHLPQEYLDQLAFGLVFEQVREGKLLTLDLVTKTLLVWKVRLSTRELEEYTRRFMRQYRKIMDAVKRRDPSILKPKYEECEYCPYCYPGGCPYFRK